MSKVRLNRERLPEIIEANRNGETRTENGVTIVHQKEKNVKVVLNQVLCGKDGNGFPGTVLDIPKDKTITYWDAVKEENVTLPEAEYMIAQKMARPFDAQADRKARQFGLVKAAER